MSTTIEVYAAPAGGLTAEVAFRADGWVNATQMAKAFGKRPNDFSALPATKAYRSALAARLVSLPENLVVTQNGGACPGTWMHPDLALKFAGWLSPDFDVWIHQTIRRVMSGGVAGLGGTEVKALLALVGELKGQLEQYQAERRGLQVKALFGDNYASQNRELRAKLAEFEAGTLWTEAERKQRFALAIWLKGSLAKGAASEGIRATALLAEAMSGLAAQSVKLPRPRKAQRWIEEIIFEAFGCAKRNDIVFPNGAGRGWKYLRLTGARPSIPSSLATEPPAPLTGGDYLKLLPRTA